MHVVLCRRRIGSYLVIGCWDGRRCGIVLLRLHTSKRNKRLSLVRRYTEHLGQDEGQLPGGAALPGLYLLQGDRGACSLLGKLISADACFSSAISEPGAEGRMNCA